MQVEAAQANQIPRYLFRISDWKSPGTTNTTKVSSPGWDRGDGTKCIHAEMLTKHLQWACSKRGEAGCNLMSWTSSLLFALAYGFYRHRTNIPHTPLSDIRLLIVDTSKFPPGTFTSDLDLMEKYRNEDQDLQENLQSLFELRTKTRNGVYYFGEYLSLGSVKVRGKCASTTMQELMNHGLASFRKGIDDGEESQYLAHRVVKMRVVFDTELFRETPEELVRKAIRLARECFGAAWALPVAAMLLNLDRRDDESHETILQVFEKEFAGASNLTSRRTVFRAFVLSFNPNSRLCFLLGMISRSLFRRREDWLSLVHD